MFTWNSKMQKDQYLLRLISLVVSGFCIFSRKETLAFSKEYQRIISISFFPVFDKNSSKSYQLIFIELNVNMNTPSIQTKMRIPLEYIFEYILSRTKQEELQEKLGVIPLPPILKIYLLQSLVKFLSCILFLLWHILLV